MAPRQRSRYRKLSGKRRSQHKGQHLHVPKTRRDHVSRDVLHMQASGHESALLKRKQKHSARGPSRRTKKSREVKKAARTDMTNPLAED